MRRALVIASEFGAAADPNTGQMGDGSAADPGDQPGGDERLAFMPDLARTLVRTLAPQWSIHGNAPVLNPTAANAKKAITAAVAAASEGGETLLLAFLGHGETAEGDQATPDFYLQFDGSSPQPNSETSIHLVQFLKEQLRCAQAANLNGLVVLVDTCSAGGVPVQAAMSGKPIGGRLEMLVASDDGPAFNGCFTTTLIGALTAGIAHAGETVHPANVYPRILAECKAQSPVHLSYTNGYLNPAGSHDPALWLMPNRTRSWHPLLGRPDAGILDQVSEGVLLSRNQKIALQETKENLHRRLRILTGPAGAGKTTVLASLVSPQLDRFDQLTASNISAAAFLSRATTPEAVITELADQLATPPSAAGGDDPAELPPASPFAAARRQVEDEIKAGRIPGSTDLLDRALILPLARSLDPASDPTQIVIDGLDQVRESQATAFHNLVARLATADGLERLRVILGVRDTGKPLPDQLTKLGFPIHVAAPNWDDLPARARPDWFTQAIEQHRGQVIPSGWLTVRLLDQLQDPPDNYNLATVAQAFLAQALHRLDDPKNEAIANDTIAIFGVAGVGPVLPLVVLKQALKGLGHDPTDAGLGTVLATLGPLVLRGRAGFADEHAGFAHLEISHALTTPIPE